MKCGRPVKCDDWSDNDIKDYGDIICLRNAGHNPPCIAIQIDAKLADARDSITPPPIPLPSGEGVSNIFFDSDKQRRH